jgi:hypothetical protein
MEFSFPSPRGTQARNARPPVALLCFTLTQCLLLGWAVAAPTPADTELAIRQTEALRQKQIQQKQASEAAAPAADEPPETYPGENQDLGPQMLLKKKKKKPLFEFSSDTMFTWTSNALSAASHPREAGIVAETLSLAVAPDPVDLGPGKLGIRAGYRHLIWMYDAAKLGHARSVNDTSFGSLNGNNFEMSTFFLGTNYSFAEDWNASLGLDFNRIMSDQHLDEDRLASERDKALLEGRSDPSTPSEWSLGRMADYSKWTEIYAGGTQTGPFPETFR